MKNSNISDFDFLGQNDLISLENPEKINGGHPLAIGFAAGAACVFCIMEAYKFGYDYATARIQANKH
jgi:hypothetical protein